MDNKPSKKEMHTPTPWEVDVMGYLRGPLGENILEEQQNAFFILKAVNEYEESQQRIADLEGLIWKLVEALDKAVQVAWDGPSEPKGTGYESEYTWRMRVKEEVKATLAKAQSAMEKEGKV